MGAATAAAPVAGALFIPAGSLDPLASSSLHCIANCSYFSSRRASDGALVATQPHSYHWARNETMDFFISFLTLTACLPCIRCLLCCSVSSVGNGRKRRAMASCHIFKKYPFAGGLLTNYAARRSRACTRGTLDLMFCADEFCVSCCLHGGGTNAPRERAASVCFAQPGDVRAQERT